MVGLIMDGILMALLVAALVFGLRLHKNLKTLRAGQEQFARAVHELDAAAIRAHASLKELRGNADESQELLHGRILAARDLLQKLEGQVARAERAHKDLENGIVSAAAVQVRQQPSPVFAAAPQPAVQAVVPPVTRRPFDRDIAHAELNPQPPRTRTSLLPAMTADDDGEMIDKVHMSELVVANLNEMIRSLNMPKRQALSVEDELFGQDDK